MTAFNKIPARHNPFRSAGAIAGATIAVAAKVGSVIKVTVTLADEMGTPAQGNGNAVRCRAYLSDDNKGNTLTATVPSGGIAIATNGIIVNQAVAGKTLDILVPTTAPNFDLNITHATAKNYFLCVELSSGEVIVSPVIAF